MQDIPTAAEVMRVIRAAYKIEQPKPQWLRGIIEAMSSGLSYGAGVEGLLYDCSGSSRVEVDAIDGLGLPESWGDAGLVLHRDSAFSAHLVANLRRQLSGSLSELLAENTQFTPWQREVFARHGVAGQILINGRDDSGKGCCFYLFSRLPFALPEALREVLNELAGHLSIAYRLQRQRESLAQEELRPPHSLLSEREQQVAALAASGLSNKAIAIELGLAFSTVRVLMARACNKLGVGSRRELQESLPCPARSLVAV